MFYEIRIYRGNTIMSYGVFADVNEGIRFVLNRLHHVIKKDIKKDIINCLDEYCLINNYSYRIEIVN
jgi:hypothetical protein